MPAKPKASIDPETAQADAASVHDAWFRAEVEAAVREADDPNTVWVSNEEVKRRFALRRAEWAKEAAKKARFASWHGFTGLRKKSVLR